MHIYSTYLFIQLVNLTDVHTYTCKSAHWWLGFKPQTPSLKTNPLHLYHGPPSPFGTNFGMLIPAIYTTGKPFRHTHVEVNIWQLGFKPQTTSLQTNSLHLYHGPPSPFETCLGMFIPAIYTTGKPFRHTHIHMQKCTLHIRTSFQQILLPQLLLRCFLTTRINYTQYLKILQFQSLEITQDD